MLFDPYALRELKLANRLVMAPLTRNRAVDDHNPNALMAEYYAQRATMGLIITEGTAPAASGLGYARIPGLFLPRHVPAWKATTDAVHANGGKIFVQLMHTGRASHTDNMPAGARIVGPTDAPMLESIFTDSSGLQPAGTPHALDAREIAATVAEYADSARLAIAAGFDGVELHGANGYLIDQFLNGNVNTRTDQYGRSIVDRNRFAVEVAHATVTAIGADRVGIRLSPFGVFNQTGAFAEVEPQYLALARQLNEVGLLYLHLVDHSSMGAPPIPEAFRASLRSTFKGLFIASGGFDAVKAEAALASGAADLVAFGRAALANPDLVARMQANRPLNAPDAATFYTAGAHGYTDYPTMDGRATPGAAGIVSARAA